MDGQLFDVVEIQAISAEKVIKGGHGEVAQMLVVYRIELAMVDQILYVRHLNDSHPLVFQQDTNSFHKAVCVSYMSQYIVCVDHIGLASLVCQL